MTCLRIPNGIICVGKPSIRLRLLDGSYVFMEWHHYSGPMFFKDKANIREIENWYDFPLLVKAQDWFIKRGKKA